MEARNIVCDTYLSEKRIELLVLSPPPPVYLYGYYFGVKETFNHLLKIKEFFKNFRFKLEEINPGKFAEVIDKTNIVFLPSNRIRSKVPYIRKDKLKRLRRNTS
jgi:hypothetical protein